MSDPLSRYQSVQSNQPNLVQSVGLSTEKKDKILNIFLAILIVFLAVGGTYTILHKFTKKSQLKLPSKSNESPKFNVYYFEQSDNFELDLSPIEDIHRQTAHFTDDSLSVEEEHLFKSLQEKLKQIIKKSQNMKSTISSQLSLISFLFR